MENELLKVTSLNDPSDGFEGPFVTSCKVYLCVVKMFGVNLWLQDLDNGYLEIKNI